MVFHWFHNLVQLYKYPLNYAPPHSYFFSHPSKMGVDPKVLCVGKVNYMVQYFSDYTHTMIVWLSGTISCATEIISFI